MLHVACCMLHVACSMLHVALSPHAARSPAPLLPRTTMYLACLYCYISSILILPGAWCIAACALGLDISSGYSYISSFVMVTQAACCCRPHTNPSRMLHGCHALWGGSADKGVLVLLKAGATPNFRFLFSPFFQVPL